VPRGIGPPSGAQAAGGWPPGAQASAAVVSRTRKRAGGCEVSRTRKRSRDVQVSRTRKRPWACGREVARRPSEGLPERGDVARGPK